MTVRHDLFYCYKNFELHTCIEEETGKESWTRLEQFIQWLELAGAQPRGRQNASQSPVEGPQTASKDGEHFCTVHNTPFKQYSKDGKTWYAHKAGDAWCNEAKAKNGKAA